MSSFSIATNLVHFAIPDSQHSLLIKIPHFENKLSGWHLCDKGSCQKKKLVFFGRSLPNLFTHPRVFVRFGRTKGEIWVEKGDFRGDLGGFWGVWTLFGRQPPHPPTFGRDLPKKTGFSFGSFPNLKISGTNFGPNSWSQTAGAKNKHQFTSCAHTQTKN